MTSGKRIDEADKRRIMRMAASGIPVKHICQRLGLDNRTVKKHMPDGVRLSSGVDKPSRRTT